MRQLASIRRVDEIQPIPDADAIECLRIGGWRVVSKKGEMNEGDLVVYFEIDSFLPKADERFEFLMKRGTKVLEGVEGFRLRTIKLRGQISQGLALPLDHFPELSFDPTTNEVLEPEEDMDVTERLNIIKYERPEPLRGQRPGRSKGNFPHFIRKTDEERIQNVKGATMKQYDGVTFIPSLKLDGSSTTVYYVKDEAYFIKPEEGQTEQVGICSRNMILDAENDPDNLFVRGALKSNLFEIAMQMGRKYDWNVALQGETIGEGIVRSWEKIEGPQTFVFSIYDIDRGEYVTANRLLQLIDEFNITSTKFYEPMTIFDYDRDAIIEMADGPSLVSKVREGLVFKSTIDGYSFKAISNRFLLKAGD